MFYFNNYFGLCGFEEKFKNTFYFYFSYVKINKLLTGGVVAVVEIKLVTAFFPGWQRIS